MTSATLAAATTTGARHTKHRRAAAAATSRGVTALMYASQQGDVERVRKIIAEQPTTLRICDRTGKTPLHYCSTSDSICAAQAADLLVMAAPDLVDSRDEDGFTPLHLAVIAGNMPLVTFLLANKADINAVDNEKHTVVHWATVCGETAALSAVLTAGAPVSTPDVHGGYPLHYAAQMCGGEKDSDLGLRVLQTLLAHSDIVVSVQDGDGRQPLLWAASAGSAKAVLALVRAGASVESPDKDGLTALHCAASRGHTDCIDTLLTLCGASTDVIDSNGCTALHYAVTLGHADATALLLAHGADPNRQDRKGRTPAHCGCAKAQFETVKMIGTHGANLWLRNARGDLPLHEAAASGRRDLIRWLLAMRPSQVNARNNDGRCPLHLAAMNDNADMCKILLDAGAQINPVLRTSKNTFMTPLDCALQRGFRSTAKYLQLHGGVPATRLGDIRYNQANSGVKLQIRDDVTFWGDTSSDSERENGEIGKSNKRIQRKKISQKYDRKRATLSGSDVEPKLVNGKLENVGRRRFGEKNQKTRSDSATSSDLPKKSKMPPTTKLNYKNEIVINGKTEINIHKQVNVLDENEAKAPVATATEVVEAVVNKASVDKEKRPRSAKSVKVKDQRKEDSAKKKTKAGRPNSNQKQGNKEQSNPENETSVKEEKDNLVSNTNEIESLSNTSEDVEEHKNVIVEAAVHEPPKQSEEEAKTDVVKEEQLVEATEIQRVAEETKDSVTHDKEKEDVVFGDDEAESAAKTDENIESFEAAKNAEDPVVVGKNVETNEEVTVEPVANEEATVDPVANEEVTVGPVANEEISITEPEQQKDVNELPITEEVASTQESTETSGENKASDEKGPSDVTKENSDEVATTDAAVNENMETQTEVNETMKEDKEESVESVEKVDDEKSDQITEKAKTKRSHRRKQKPSGDQAYELIYQTLGAEDDNVQDEKSTRKEKLKPQKTISETKSSEEYSSDVETESSTSASLTVKEHKSFRILDDQEAEELDTKPKVKKDETPPKKQRSRSEESKDKKSDRQKRSKSKTTLSNSRLSKSDKYLNIPERKATSGMDSRVPSLPNINGKIKDTPRSESNMSAPPLASVYSDEEVSASDVEEKEETQRSSAAKRKKMKRKSKAREARSAGSDYESSNVIDSGFEPSPRSSRIPKWKNMTERGVNMTSVTQSIQSNIRRYHLERKIFQHLLDLKRMQIRAGQHNEAVLVKRAIDAYHQSCAATVGAGRYVPEDYSFKSFEKFLYLSLRKLQRNGADYLKGLPETPENPLLCTRSTHRCMHATHAYTGIPCAAYLPKMDHHTIPKIGFGSTECKPGTGFLPTINAKKAVTLELSHGNDKQVISLPADRLDQNKRYYVTFTVKGSESTPPDEETSTTGHRHSKSD